MARPTGSAATSRTEVTSNFAPAALNSWPGHSADWLKPGSARVAALAPRRCGGPAPGQRRGTDGTARGRPRNTRTPSAVTRKGKSSPPIPAVFTRIRRGRLADRLAFVVGRPVPALLVEPPVQLGLVQDPVEVVGDLDHDRRRLPNVVDQLDVDLPRHVASPGPVDGAGLLHGRQDRLRQRLPRPCRRGHGSRSDSVHVQHPGVMGHDEVDLRIVRQLVQRHAYRLIRRRCRTPRYVDDHRTRHHPGRHRLREDFLVPLPPLPCPPLGLRLRGLLAVGVDLDEADLLRAVVRVVSRRTSTRYLTASPDRLA